MRKGFEEDPVLEEKLLDWLITQGYSWRTTKRVWWSHYLLVSKQSVHNSSISCRIKLYLLGEKVMESSIIGGSAIQIP